MADFQNLVRIAETDLDGNKKMLVGLAGVKGVDFPLANAISKTLELDTNKKLTDLSEDDISNIEDLLKNPGKYNIPSWLLNRRKDPETGEDNHLVGSNVKFVTDNDIKLMKKIKSYKGLRHQWGLTVRGQSTKANFRKSRTMGAKKRK